MPGTAKLSIWNLALGHVAQRPISSDTDPSIMAEACERAWDPLRREVLRECNWGFAAAFEQLSVVSTFTPPLGWAYAYAYPVKCLAIRKIFSPQEVASAANLNIFQTAGQVVSYGSGSNRLATPIRETTGEKFREVYDKDTNTKIILSNTQNAIIEYTYDVEDTTLFDASCVTLCGYRLGCDIATPLTGDSSIAVNLMKIYNMRLSVSQQLNSTENNERALGETGAVDARG